MQAPVSLLNTTYFRRQPSYRMNINNPGRRIKLNLFAKRNQSTTRAHPQRHKKNIAWIDMEMTGLNSSVDLVLEVTCIVTDQDLKPLDTGISLVLQAPDAILSNMGEWCQSHHSQSGLLDQVRLSHLDAPAGDELLCSWLSERVISPAIIAGNSVHFDKRFLEKHFPKTSSLLSHRLIDVTSIQELCRRWYPEHYWARPTKSKQHRSLADIEESIRELQYYRETIFRIGLPTK